MLKAVLARGRKSRFLKAPVSPISLYYRHNIQFSVLSIRAPCHCRDPRPWQCLCFSFCGTLQGFIFIGFCVVIHCKRGKNRCPGWTFLDKSLYVVCCNCRHLELLTRKTLSILYPCATKSLWRKTQELNSCCRFMCRKGKDLNREMLIIRHYSLVIWELYNCKEHRQTKKRAMLSEQYLRDSWGGRTVETVE